MHIWLMEIGETLPVSSTTRKLRMGNLADALAAKGHSVLWWGSAFDHLAKQFLVQPEKPIDLAPNVQAVALKSPGYQRNISLARFRDHKILARRFRKAAPTWPAPDGIVASLPSYDLAFEAVKYGRKFGVPVIVDVQDQWPEMFLDHVPPAFRPFARMALYGEFKKAAWCMKHANALHSMMNTILEWGLKLAGRQRTHKDRVFYLGAPPLPSPLAPSARVEAILPRLTGKFVVTFIGTFASYHNPSILVECARRMSNAPICFVLAGSGELYSAVEQAAAGLSNVILPGWMNQTDIQNLLRHSHVGVCPSNRVAAFCPNKAFTYLSGGLPILSAFEGDLKSIIEDNQIGFFFPPGNLEVLSAKLHTLINNPSEYDRMAENARRVFQERFSVDKIYPAYASHIEKIFKT